MDAEMITQAMRIVMYMVLINALIKFSLRDTRLRPLLAALAVHLWAIALWIALALTEREIEGLFREVVLSVTLVVAVMTALDTLWAYSMRNPWKDPE